MSSNQCRFLKNFNLYGRIIHERNLMFISGFDIDKIWDYQETGTYCEKRETDCTYEFKGYDPGNLIKGDTHTCQHLEKNYKRGKPEG